MATRNNLRINFLLRALICVKAFWQDSKDDVLTTFCHAWESLWMTPGKKNTQKCLHLEHKYFILSPKKF